ncbi:amidase family protein [Micromonospora sp. CPCC 205539]|uniref:amidase family protein n=1 Tax=Micromonospora sp. CPCC 205539 TaxID=3122408 RepID=UPI002FF3F170
MDELCWWSAGRVAAAVAARTLSAREYLDVLLARIERYNAPLGLVTTLDERAYEWARRADEAVVRGDRLGPLHGVAMTVKDSLATGGLRTTGGVPVLSGFVPREDGAAVAGLRRAGAIVFGKTNLAAASADIQSYNDVFGTARNPWHPDHSTSGSSGGGAGAVASGFTPVELGSDVAGSIRLPASACGVFGHKPSFGIVPMHGHIPPMPFKQTTVDLAVTGPLARTVDDLETVLRATVGPHPWDQPAWQVSLPPAQPVRRIAAWVDDPYCPVDAEVAVALQTAVDAFCRAGIAVEPARPPGVRLAESDQVFRQLLAGFAASTGPAGGNAARLGGELADRPLNDWFHADAQRQRLRQHWRQFFSRYDAILLPVAPNLAIRHDHRPIAARQITVDAQERPYWQQTVWAGLTGVVYLPSTVVPVRLDTRGLPVGVAIAGPYLGDLTTLAAARLLAEHLDPIGTPPLDRLLSSDA